MLDGQIDAADFCKEEIYDTNQRIREQQISGFVFDEVENTALFIYEIPSNNEENWEMKRINNRVDAAYTNMTENYCDKSNTFCYIKIL